MAAVTDIKNPFVGLRAFEEDEDYLFFGRTAEINDLLKKFSNSRLLAVVGSSGSGKSSLVKSGLLPAIYSGFLSVGRNWRVAVFRPGDDPIGNITKELAKQGVLNNDITDSNVPVEVIIESTLRRSTSGLIQAYQQAHFTTPENLLIVIDQFEELFRYSRYERQKNSGKSDAMQFVNLLLTATRQSICPVYVLITMRSDFIGDCAEFRGLPEAINEGQYLVPRMTRDEIREAIKGPIAVGNANITQRLITRLLNDVGNDLDQLPILQHAMMRTWDAWENKNLPDTPIDIDDYEKIGGMKTALSLHAEEIFAKLTTDRQQKICELIFKALTDKAADVRGIRRPTSVEDLCVLTSATSEEVVAIVEIFRKQGRTFLMPPTNVLLTDKSIIDISHESLMRIWQRLIQWTEEEVRWANIYKRLGSDALNEAKREAGLWGDPELALGISWRNNFGSDVVRKIWAKSFDVDYEQALDFLNRSEIADKKQKKEKARRILIMRLVGVSLILLFAILSGISYYQMKEADKAKKTAQENLVSSYNSEIGRLTDEKRIDSINEISFGNYNAKDVASYLRSKQMILDERLGRLNKNKDSLNRILKNKTR
jgi:hypothetical protein